MLSFVPEIDLYTFCQIFFITFKAHFSLVYYDSQCVPCKQEKEKKIEVSELLYRLRGVIMANKQKRPKKF